jgi:peptide chain release factor 1
LKESDLKYRWFSGTGAGGQHRNKKMCSLELIHLPTGLSRIAQSRSREANARDARAELMRALSEQTDASFHLIRNDIRAAQIGLGMRADKRRTYRFQEDRVVDHITGKSMKATAFMKGRINQLWDIAKG